MHGRVRVRTTEEEAIAKKKEQELKLKAYRYAMMKILEKRKLEEYDDEMKNFVAQVLLKNPDILTLWGVRKQCILKEVETVESSKQSEEQNIDISAEDGQCSDEVISEQTAQIKLVDNNDKLTDLIADDGIIADTVQQPKLPNSIDTATKQIQAVYEKELLFAEQCLRSNPKSYGAWHHRCWSLENSPEPNWLNELYICERYLKLDERNFHTWDYRRYVVEKCRLDPQVDLDFCTEKIKSNFSNYSSWHHRSLILPKLHPHEHKATSIKRPMSEEKLKEELEMVITAAFTDPDDSSAWFYQRWLLGHSRAELNVCAFRCSKQKAVLSFTHATELSGLKASIKQDDEELCMGSIRSLNSSPIDNTFVITLPENLRFNCYSLQLCVSHSNWPISKKYPLSSLNDTTAELFYFSAPYRSVAFSSLVITELETQLESCECLLEYEPDSKWTLLTSALLMRAIDSDKFHAKTLAYLQKLQTVDSLREGYYSDLASKWIMEKKLEHWVSTKEIPRKIDLSNESQLSALCFAQYLCIADEILLPEALKIQFKQSGIQIPTFKSVEF